MDTSTPPDATTLPTKHSALLEVIDLARARERTLVDSLDADARTAVGTVERWAPKDHFVHLGVWAAYQARRLEAVATGSPATQPADNDTVFLEHRDDPWETTWADPLFPQTSIPSRRARHPVPWSFTTAHMPSFTAASVSGWIPRSCGGSTSGGFPPSAFT